MILDSVFNKRASLLRGAGCGYSECKARLFPFRCFVWHKSMILKVDSDDYLGVVGICPNIVPRQGAVCEGKTTSTRIPKRGEDVIPRVG